MKNKKCGICGYEFMFEDKAFESPFVKPFGEGAKYYYDLWHYSIECCPECGYASKDISNSAYKKLIEDENFKGISEMDILIELNRARPNRIGDYLKASYYYESIGDILNNVKCLLQAGDLVYAELMYWDEYVFDHNDSVSALISKTQYNELKKFGDFLFDSGLGKLEQYCKDNPEDVDSKLLLGGSLCDGNKIQEIKGTRILMGLKSVPLNVLQKSALEFLLDEVN